MKKIIYHIVVIGAGGTGGNLLPRVAQFITSFSTDKYKPLFTLSIIDGDLVEEKNLKRQPFMPDDISLNKAEVLAEAVGDVYGIDVSANARFLDSTEDLKNILEIVDSKYGNGYYRYDTTKIYIIFGCIDNHAARMVIENTIEEMQNVIYIDAANEYDYGEVVFFCNIRKAYSPARSHYFPEIRHSRKKRSEESCDLLNNEKPQHLATNLMAANICFTAFADFLTEGTIPNGIVHFRTFDYMLSYYPYKGDDGDERHTS